jgi:hypothetical protein
MVPQALQVLLDHKDLLVLQALRDLQAAALLEQVAHKDHKDPLDHKDHKAQEALAT